MRLAFLRVSSRIFITMHRSPIREYRSAYAGFTLIEILVSIAIFLLLTGGAAFIVVTFLVSTDLNETSAQIAQTLRIARERSMAGLNNAQYGVYFDGTNRRYVLYQGASYNTRNSALDTVTDIVNTLTVTTTFSGDVNFSRLGNATINGRITLAHSIGGNRTVDINQFGIISQGGTGSSGGVLPILVITNPANPFSRYYGEILLTEGVNEFIMKDIAEITPAMLAAYDVAILGEMALTSDQTAMLNDWVGVGGNLIAMRPNLQANPAMATLLGLTTTGTTLSDAYLLVNTASGPGVGIVGQTIQFHGVADRYDLVSGTLSVATLYSSAGAGTANPAVTLRSVGTQGGEVAAFTYDLARSVVYTRQGNPTWAGQDRNGDGLIRPTDLFYVNPIGALDWVDFNKIMIPQADEQQRLLVNLILRMNADKKPLPRFWYFPRGGKAVLVMTGDDHGNGGTAGRLNQYRGQSAPGCNVANWECIRSTSYIYPNSPPAYPYPSSITNAEVAGFLADGFEIGLHVNTGCANFNPSSLATTFTDDLAAFHLSYPSIPASDPVTVRTHCGPWSDYDTHPQVALSKGIRFDTNYYFWPNPWVNDRPGLFTGSGMPMRFTTLTGNILDIYQAPTQMQDQKEATPVQSYPYTSDTLFTNAIGPLGYYGLFVAIAHTDNAVSNESDYILASARTRNIPIISSAQALAWTDGKNNSSFSAISWSGTTLSFNAAVDAKANGMYAMVPYNFGINSVFEVRRNGIPVSLPLAEIIKGVVYQMFPISSGSYTVAYADLPPTRFNSQPSGGLPFSTTQVTLSLSTSENATCKYGTLPGVAYDAMTNTFTTSGGTAHAQTKAVLSGQNYNFYVRCKDNTGNANTDDFAISFSVSSDPSLVAYWRMNEGSGPSTFDSSGFNNTGGITSAIWTTGISGSGLQFDGVVSVGSPPALDFPGPMSFFAWARFGTVQGGQYGRYPIGQCVSTTLGQFGMTVGRLDTNKLTVGWGAVEIINSTPTLVTGQWYFIGFTRSGSSGNWTARIYINGAPNQTVSGIGTNPGLQMPLSLGRCGTFNTLYFNGILDEVRLYNRALNDAEVMNLYTGG